MKKIILVYGSISGAIIIGMGLLTIELDVASVWLGFLVMFIALSSIFVAVRQVRDHQLGGVIRFGTGFMIGLGISLVASAVYVIAWEFYLSATDYSFVDWYVNSLIESSRIGGASAAELQQVIRETDQFREQYANPLFRVPMTFVEIFPVGLIVSLVTAFKLKNAKKT